MTLETALRGLAQRWRERAKAYRELEEFGPVMAGTLLACALAVEECVDSAASVEALKSPKSENRNAH